jgi:hypothetical protein
MINLVHSLYTMDFGVADAGDDGDVSQEPELPAFVSFMESPQWLLMVVQYLPLADVQALSWTCRTLYVEISVPAVWRSLEERDGVYDYIEPEEEDDGPPAGADASSALPDSDSEEDAEAALPDLDLEVDAEASADEDADASAHENEVVQIRRKSSSQRVQRHRRVLSSSRTRELDMVALATRARRRG